MLGWFMGAVKRRMRLMDRELPGPSTVPSADSADLWRRIQCFAFIFLVLFTPSPTFSCSGSGFSLAKGSTWQAGVEKTLGWVNVSSQPGLSSPAVGIFPS